MALECRSLNLLPVKTDKGVGFLVAEDNTPRAYRKGQAIRSLRAIRTSESVREEIGQMITEQDQLDYLGDEELATLMGMLTGGKYSVAGPDLIAHN